MTLFLSAFSIVWILRLGFVRGNQQPALTDGKFLSFDGPPRIMEKYPRVIWSTVGGSVRLTCPLERPRHGSSPDESETIVVWRKNDKVIGLGWLPRFKTDEDQLTIGEAEEQDSGNYTCTATNGFGSVVGYYLLCVAVSTPDGGERISGGLNAEICAVNNQQRNAKIPEPGLETLKFVENVLVDTKARAGEVVSFNCQVQSSLLTRIQWFRRPGADPPKWYGKFNSKQTPYKSQRYVPPPHLFNSSAFIYEADSYEPLLGPDFLIQNKPTSLNVYSSRLTLKRTSGRDAGLYVCFASNNRGFNYQFGFLKIASDMEEHEPEDAFHTMSSGKLTWVAALVVCIVTLVFVVVVIVLVKRCRKPKCEQFVGRRQQQIFVPSQRGQQQHQQQSTQSASLLSHNNNNNNNSHSDTIGNRMTEYYQPSTIECSQSELREPFFNHMNRQQYMFRYPDLNDHHSGECHHNVHPNDFHHNVHPNYFPSTNSSDKTNSSYQSNHHLPLKVPVHSNNNVLFQHQQHGCQQQPTTTLWPPHNQTIFY